MPAPKSTTSLLRLFIGVVAVVTLVVYFSPSTPSALVAKMSSSSSDTTAESPIPGLVVTLAQVPDANPPAFRATITNRNPRPVCFLDYDSPVDSLVVPLGLVEITPASPADAKPIDIDLVKLRRLWPPKVDFVQEIAGNGGTYSEVIPIRAKNVPHEKLGDKFYVQMRGQWRAVMAMPKSEITDEFLEHIPARPNTFQGKWESDRIEMTVDRASLEL